MQKKKSFVKQIIKYLLILTALLITVIGVFIFSSYTILNHEIKDSSEAFLTIYGNELSNTMSKMYGYIINITTQGEDLAKIESISENERTLASVSLHNYMQDLILKNEVASAIVVSDSKYNVCLDAIKAGLNSDKKNRLREFSFNAINNKEISTNEWGFLKLDQEIFVYIMLKNENRTIAIFNSANDLLSHLSSKDNGNRVIILVNQDGEIGKLWGNETPDIKYGANLSDINRDNYYVTSKSIIDGQLSIYCYTAKYSMIRQIDTSMIVVAVIVCLTFLFMLFILWFTRKEIALPMYMVVDDMRRIEEGEYKNRINGNFNTKEFQMLQETTNRMVDEIVKFKIQTYEKRIELQDMELKSIRLQLKPHYFLNALTTISSLSSQNKNEQIIKYIDAFAKNIRYIFRAGFHTVSLKDEMKHVENYFEIQELKYPGSIFYLIDMPHELEDWKIPQMLIHTFVENLYKHAVTIDKTLTLLIKVSKVCYKGEDMMLVEIEDDGKGYPQEVLDYMNDISSKVNEKGKRIGLWSIKRMIELMYERSDLVYIENIRPHGCLNRIYIPQIVKHELAEETIQTKI